MQDQVYPIANAIILNVPSYEGEGVINGNGKMDIQLRLTNDSRFQFAIQPKHIIQPNCSIIEDRLFVEFTCTPALKNRLQETLKSVDSTIESSTILIVFSEFNSQDDFSVIEGFFCASSEQHEEQQVIDITRSPSPKGAKTPRKGRKKKSEDESDYEPSEKKPRKIQIKGESSRISHRTRSRRNPSSYVELDTEITLSESEQIQKAINLSLKDAPAESFSNDANNTIVENEGVNLYENVDLAMELFTYRTIRNEVIVRMEDYICLSRNEYLSDVIIDLMISYIYNEKFTDEQRSNTYIFNSHFYRIYATSSDYLGWKNDENVGLTAAEKRYKRVEGFINPNDNIFEKDFIVMPLNADNHWFLAIICFPQLNGSTTLDGKHVSRENATTKSSRDPEDPQQPIKSSCILIFDSIKGSGARRTIAMRHIRTFLRSEYEQKYKNQFKFDDSALISHNVSVPHQDNNVDCGCFLLEYFEHFFVKSPITDFRIPIELSHWFDPDHVKREKRKEIALCIQDLLKSWDISIELPCISFVGDSQITLEHNDEVVDNQNNNNNNDEEFNNNNDFNCLDSNTNPALSIPNVRSENDGAENDFNDVADLNESPNIITDNEIEMKTVEPKIVEQSLTIDTDNEAIAGNNLEENETVEVSDSLNILSTSNSNTKLKSSGDMNCESEQSEPADNDISRQQTVLICPENELSIVLSD